MNLRKLNLKLTVLFVCITEFILVIMSVSYICIIEKSQKNSSYLSFINQSTSIIDNFSNSDMITDSWLNKESTNNNLIIAVYDNAIPLSHNTTALSRKEQKLAYEVLESVKPKLTSRLASVDYTLSTHDFTYTNQDTSYYANAALLTKDSSNLHIIILYSTEPLYHKFFMQHLTIIAINLIGIILLSLFTYFYIRKLLAPIKENEQKQNNFIATASHELRTPLAVILSSADALSKASTEQQKDFLSIIDSEGKRMARLISDMLMIAKNNNHTWMYDMKPAELDTLILNSYESFFRIASEKNIQLMIDLPEDDLPLFYCDSHRITQVIDIFISNAISYGKENGYVKLILQYHSSTFHIYVEDNGIGISDEAKKHVFERFYRENKAHTEKEHFGLGLCIAHEIVKAHHGSISLTDTKGGGTTFHIVLPEHHK